MLTYLLTYLLAITTTSTSTTTTIGQFKYLLKISLYSETTVH